MPTPPPQTGSMAWPPCGHSHCLVWLRSHLYCPFTHADMCPALLLSLGQFSTSNEHRHPSTGSGCQIWHNRVKETGCRFCLMQMAAWSYSKSRELDTKDHSLRSTVNYLCALESQMASLLAPPVLIVYESISNVRVNSILNFPLSSYKTELH